MKPHAPKLNEKGFVLLAVYMTVIFIASFALALFARHQVALQGIERYQNRILAFNAAEAGIDVARRQLTESGAVLNLTSGSGSLPQSTFHYTIGPVEGHNTLNRIESTGCAPNCNAGTRAGQSSNIIVYAQISTPAPPGSLFEYGIFVTGDNLSLSGATFDSYNSNHGAYGGSNVSTDGAVAADSGGIGDISLSNSTVKGDVLAGEGSNPNTVITTSNSSITGSKGNLPSGWTLPGPTPIDELATPPTEIDLSSVTSARTLSAGTYHCTQISISGSKGAIVTTGAVKIYVDGGVQITGQGTTVPNNQPGNLHIYVTGTASVKIAGNGSFYGGIYAPNSDVTFQTSNSGKGGVLFGAVVAKTFTTFGGGTKAIHFDLAMAENSQPDPNQLNITHITAWQEMGSLAWGTGTTT